MTFCFCSSVRPRLLKCAGSDPRALGRAGATGVNVREGSVKENPAGESEKFLAPRGATDILSAYTGRISGTSPDQPRVQGHVKQCSGGAGLHRRTSHAPLGPRELRPPLAT